MFKTSDGGGQNILGRVALATHYLLTITTKHGWVLALIIDSLAIIIIDVVTIYFIPFARGESELGFAEMTVLYCFAVHKLLELDLPCYSTMF